MVLEIAGESLTLLVSDNGQGFAPDSAKADHFGLIGMRERARTIGAQISIVSAKGQGTSVSVSLRLQRSEVPGRAGVSHPA